MDETWIIESKCENIRIWSEYFEVDDWSEDLLWIGTNEYTGNAKINQTVKNNSTIRFKSDGGMNKAGFKLIWTCD